MVRAEHSCPNRQATEGLGLCHAGQNYYIYLLGGFKKALRRFSAELPKSDSDICLGQFDSDFPAVTLTFGL